jgi:hypothetical protein
LGRDTELETLRQSLIARGIVDLHGVDGAGKSELAAALAHSIDLSHYPDGVVYVKGAVRSGDLLQILFDSFYGSEEPVKITPHESRVYLRGLQVLLILDNLGLGPNQIDPVLDSLGEAAVLILGSERTALGRGRALPLKGLPREDAINLFERAYGQKLGEQANGSVDQICALLNEIPLSVISIARYMAQKNHSPERVLAELGERKPWAGKGADLSTGPVLEQLMTILDATDRQLLTVTAALSTDTVACTGLKRLTDLTGNRFEQHLEHLVQLNLLRRIPSGQASRVSDASSDVTDRICLHSAFSQTANSWLVDDSTRRRTVDHYVKHLQRNDSLPALELPSLLGSIEECARKGWLEELELLVRAVDPTLAELRWWDEWQHLLDVTRRATQAGSNRALEAWAMHQLGSVLGALGQFDRSLHLLETALNIRQALGDRTGAELSTRNYEVLQQLAPTTEMRVPVAHEGKSPLATTADTPASTSRSQEETVTETQRSGRARGLRWVMVLASILLIAGAVTLRVLPGIGKANVEQQGQLNVSWGFGDAWNEIDGREWTQQVKVFVEGGQGELSYFVDGEPAGEMFEVVLPLCDGAQGTIRVETTQGQNAEVEFGFDSPFCR